MILSVAPSKELKGANLVVHSRVSQQIEWIVHFAGQRGIMDRDLLINHFVKYKDEIMTSKTIQDKKTLNRKISRFLDNYGTNNLDRQNNYPMKQAINEHRSIESVMESYDPRDYSLYQVKCG